jgi:hypothetical protein
MCQIKILFFFIADSHGYSEPTFFQIKPLFYQLKIVK